MTQHAAADGEEVELHANDQDWLLTWHGPESTPTGKPHGSMGICVTDAGEIILISQDGVRWDLPAGRPEGSETWAETLRREMIEEACATVTEARLLGFSRGQCVQGHEEGLILVRSIWLARAVVGAWWPEFEVQHRKFVPPAELFTHLTIEAGYFPILRRAMNEAGIRPKTT